MDPITAWGLATKAFCEMVTEIVKGQPQEVKAKAWERWMEWDDRVRKLLKLDG